VPVEQLCKGISIWTIDESGQRVAVKVMDTVSTQATSLFQMARITLNDGRVVTASPGHPTVEGRVLGDYQAGDMLDGALIIMVERITYNGNVTYDILPSGSTGLYWANGVLLRSTLWKE
jgi:intein/homing endonuclease